MRILVRLLITWAIATTVIFLTGYVAASFATAWYTLSLEYFNILTWSLSYREFLAIVSLLVGLFLAIIDADFL